MALYGGASTSTLTGIHPANHCGPVHPVPDSLTTTRFDTSQHIPVCRVWERDGHWHELACCLRTNSRWQQKPCAVEGRYFIWRRTKYTPFFPRCLQHKLVNSHTFRTLRGTPSFFI